MISRLVAQLKLDEGWRDRPYRDSEGWLTIGYGFLIDPVKDVSLPKEVGELWLEVAARERWEALVAFEPWIEDQPEDVQLALGNMAYNLGVSGVRGFRRMLDALKLGDRVKAAEHALDSRWAEQVPNRAQRVAALIRGQDW